MSVFKTLDFPQIIAYNEKKRGRATCLCLLCRENVTEDGKYLMYKVIRCNFDAVSGYNSG